MNHKKFPQFNPKAFTYCLRVPFSTIDWAGRIYYSRIFEFTQQALEDFLIASGFGSLPQLFKKCQPLPVVIHADANYFVPIELNDEIAIQLTSSRIGNTSFTLRYDVFRIIKAKQYQYSTTVNVVHVLVQNHINKVALNQKWKKLLKQIYFVQEE